MEDTARTVVPGWTWPGFRGGSGSSFGPYPSEELVLAKSRLEDLLSVHIILIHLKLDACWAMISKILLTSKNKHSNPLHNAVSVDCLLVLLDSRRLMCISSQSLSKSVYKLMWLVNKPIAMVREAVWYQCPNVTGHSALCVNGQSAVLGPIQLFSFAWIQNRKTETAEGKEAAATQIIATEVTQIITCLG